MPESTTLQSEAPSFFIIGVIWTGEKNDPLLVSMRGFKAGVASSHIDLFQGKASPFSGKTGAIIGPRTLLPNFWSSVFREQIPAA